MAEAKHTPGPWWVTDSGVRDAGGYICHTNKATHYPGQDERYESETAERAANARLIALAPTMLVALVEAAGTLQGAAECMRKMDAPRTADKLEEIALAAMLVVAKATGAAA